jgi:hypothetical protein
VTDPSPYDLWKQANGDGAEYRRLMTEAGMLIPLEPGEKAEPLPCGWPTSRVADDEEDHDGES